MIHTHGKKIKLFFVTSLFLFIFFSFGKTNAEDVSYQFLATIENPNFDISIATVENIDTDNKGVKLVKLRVEETIRGGIKPGITNTELRNHSYEGNSISTVKFGIPEKGEKIIVLTIVSGGDFTVFTELVDFIKYSEQNKKIVLEKMAPAERDISAQLPLFFLIIISPLINLVLFIFLLKAKITYYKKKLIRLIIFVLPIIALGAYAIYESGISSYTNIRVDLFLISPALLLSFLFYPAVIFNIIRSPKP